MPRQSVQDSDIQQFRNRLEHFERRQSEDMIAYKNSRKRRSSQCWQDVQLEQMQFTENWRDDVCFGNHKRRRSLEPLRVEKTTALPTPALPVSPRKRSRKSITPPTAVSRREAPAVTYIQPASQPLSLSMVPDPVLPSIEYEMFNMPSATFSRASSSGWESEPRTPENVFHQTPNSGISQPEFVDTSNMTNNGGMLMIDATDYNVFNNVEKRDMGLAGGGGTGYEKGGYAGADFERAFEEFMNVS